jgi:hypothetical protein
MFIYELRSKVSSLQPPKKTERSRGIKFLGCDCFLEIFEMRLLPADF